MFHSCKGGLLGESILKRLLCPLGPYHSLSADPPEGLAGRSGSTGLVPGHRGQEALKWWSQSHPAPSKASLDRGPKMQDATNPHLPTGSSSDGQLAITLTRHPKIPMISKILVFAFTCQCSIKATKWSIKACLKIEILFLDSLSWPLCVTLTNYSM